MLVETEIKSKITHLRPRGEGMMGVERTGILPTDPIPTLPGKLPIREGVTIAQFADEQDKPKEEAKPTKEEKEAAGKAENNRRNEERAGKTGQNGHDKEKEEGKDPYK